jgi:polyhydroxyalkanoate synthesis regulator phasin
MTTEQKNGEIKEGDTIMLDDLVNRMKTAAYTAGTNKKNKMLLLNAAAALSALGQRLEALSAELADLQNKPRIVGPTGLHRVN